MPPLPDWQANLLGLTLASCPPQVSYSLWVDATVLAVSQVCSDRTKHRHDFIEIISQVARSILPPRLADQCMN